MPWPKIFGVAAAITSILSLCSFFGALFVWLSSRRRESSILQKIEGEGIVKAETIIKILKEFESDESRLKALQEMLGYDGARAKGVLNKVKSEIDVGPLSLSEQIHLRKGLLITALVLVALAVTAAVAWQSSKIPIPKDPTAEQVLVNLSRNLSNMKASYKALSQSSSKAFAVNTDASQLAQKIIDVNDADLGLDMQIFKYQVLGYSWGMVLGSEMIAPNDFTEDEKLKSVQAILDACDRAKRLVDEARRAQPVTPRLQTTREWIVRDDAEPRISRLRAVALCSRWQLNHDQQDLTEVRQLRQSLPAYYVAREHPDTSYELSPCLGKDK